MSVLLLDNLTLDIGAGLGVVEPSIPVVRADPSTEYVATDLGSGGVSRNWEAEEELCGPLRWHGAIEYQRMYNTPAAGSSFNALRAATLSGGINLLPAIKPVSGLAASDEQVGGDEVEAEMAIQIADSNRRTLDSWDTPADLVLWEMMESMYLGHVMAEKVVRDVVGGPDDGLMAISCLKPLPRSSYRFLMDKSGRVGRIKAQSIQSGQWEDFEPDHFAWLTWEPWRGDPRGRSLFRMAHYHWRMLMDLWPEVYKGWKQFGVPWMYGTTAPNAKMVPPVGKDGQPLEGRRPVTAEFAMAMSGSKLVNGSIAAGPNGSDWKILESSKDSSVVSGAVSILEGQIIRSILLQLRATVEAQHGSRADSETGQDIMGTLVRFVRKWLERFLRSILMYQNRLNYGDDIARRLTPLVSLGDHEHQDFSQNAAGVGLLYQSAYFADSQLPFVDTFLGLPQRQPGDRRVGPTGIVPDVAPEQQAPAEPKPAPGDGMSP